MLCLDDFKETQVVYNKMPRFGDSRSGKSPLAHGVETVENVLRSQIHIIDLSEPKESTSEPSILGYAVQRDSDLIAALKTVRSSLTVDVVLTSTNGPTDVFKRKFLETITDAIAMFEPEEKPTRAFQLMDQTLKDFEAVSHLFKKYVKNRKSPEPAKG